MDEDTEDREPSEDGDWPDLLGWLESELDAATTTLIAAADRRAALLDLTAAARSAKHELGDALLTIERLLEVADADPIEAGTIRALIERATRKDDDR